MEERRKYGRVKAPDKVTGQVFDEATQQTFKDVKIIDISPGGVSFVCDKNIPDGTPIKLILNFPGLYFEKDIPVNAKVVHSKQGEIKFQIGCAYLPKRVNKSF